MPTHNALPVFAGDLTADGLAGQGPYTISYARLDEISDMALADEIRIHFAEEVQAIIDAHVRGVVVGMRRMQKRKSRKGAVTLDHLVKIKLDHGPLA